MIVTSDNIGTEIGLAKVGRARLNARLAFSETRSNMTSADPFFVLADPKFESLTDREAFELGSPPVPEHELQRITERIAPGGRPSGSVEPHGCCFTSCKGTWHRLRRRSKCSRSCGRSSMTPGCPASRSERQIGRHYLAIV
jgi:hypothetical protein